MEPWWTMQQSGMIGGWLGAGVGVIFGGIGGGLGGLLAAKGQAKPLVVGFFILGIVACSIMGAAGLFALVRGQPYHVWYPLVLPGVLGTTILGVLLPVSILRAYRQHEERRLAAEEFRRA